jgi:hypothetical protein
VHKVFAAGKAGSFLCSQKGAAARPEDPEKQRAAQPTSENLRPLRVPLRLERSTQPGKALTLRWPATLPRTRSHAQRGASPASPRAPTLAPMKSIAETLTRTPNREARRTYLQLKISLHARGIQLGEPRQTQWTDCGGSGLCRSLAAPASAPMFKPEWLRQSIDLKQDDEALSVGSDVSIPFLQELTASAGSCRARSGFCHFHASQPQDEASASRLGLCR